MDAAVLDPTPVGMPKFLKDLGIGTEADALRVLPVSYADFTVLKVGFGSLVVGETVILAVRMYTRVRIGATSNGNRMASFQITDGQNVMVCHCYGDNAALVDAAKIDPGELVHFIGVIRENHQSDELYLYDARLVPPSRAGRVEPSYPSDGQRSASFIERIARDPEKRRQAATNMLAHFPGETSQSLLARCGVRNGIGLDDWLLLLHCPRNMGEAKSALQLGQRLVALEVCFQAEHLRGRDEVPGSGLTLNPKQVASLLAALPFKPTADQEQAIVDCCEDVISNVPARRLISGDVGTGKTAVFATVAAASFLAGARVVILVPNLLVVEQHLSKLREWWPQIPALRVIGATNLKAPDLEARPIIVGTTALISRLTKHNYVPDLLIIDEQQKLSKEQREALIGPKTHYIEATATCIPRTMAVIAYGGMDISVVRQCPYKKEVFTKVLDSRHRKDLFDRIGKVTKAGGQVAVIYPRIEAREEKEHDKHSFDDALALWKKHFPGRVQGLHGKMKAEEKTAIIEAMRRREFDILVTTTVVEVGIDLPDLRAAVVVEADRFGLNQLHQVRGRVARHGGKGEFYLYLPNPVDDLTMRRLRVLEKVGDGFALAEEDLRLRGFGDLAQGSRQTGKAVIHSLFGAELDYGSLSSVLSSSR